MTIEEMNEARERVKNVIRDLRHPDYVGAASFIGEYGVASESTKRFMRQIAPYMFEENGTPIWETEP